MADDSRIRGAYTWLRSRLRRKPTGEARVRTQLRQEVASAIDEITGPGEQVHSDRLERLKQLSQLIALAEASREPASRRWLLAAVLGTSLIVVSLLLFVRIQRTVIELDVAVDALEFRLSDRQVLSDVFTISVLGAAGISELVVPQPSAAAGFPPPAPSGTPISVRIAAVSGAESTGDVSLAPIVAPAETRVTLQGSSQPHKYRLSLLSNGLALQVGVRGPVQIGVAGSPPVLRQYDTPRSILLRAAGLVDLDLTLKGSTAAPLMPQLKSAGLVFVRINELTDSDGTLLHHTSTIRSGTVYLEELSGRAVGLRSGEALRFDEVRGRIRSLEFRDDHIALKFRGIARGMRTGSPQMERSLMPTYLEWLHHRHALYLMWGATLSAFGVVVALLRWWGIGI